MSLYCLIHGGAHGPSGCLLTRELERRGHRVLCPALPLDRSDVEAALYVDSILDALGKVGHDADTTLVAHSSSGMFLPLVAGRCKPSRMVFLAALVPRPGVSIMDQFRDDPAMFNPAWIGKNPMQDDEAALEFVFHDCPSERLAWALSTRVFFYPKRALQVPCPSNTWASVPAAYIACAEDRTIAPAWQRRVAREWLGVDAVELPSGHCPQICRPEALAASLERS